MRAQAISAEQVQQREREGLLLGSPFYEVGTPAVDSPSLLRAIEKLVCLTKSSWVTPREVTDRLTGPFSSVFCLGMWVPAGQAIGESCGKGVKCTPQAWCCGHWVTDVGRRPWI